MAQRVLCNYKCKQEKTTLKSEHSISLGDSRPLLMQQHLAASAVPGCLQGGSYTQRSPHRSRAPTIKLSISKTFYMKDRASVSHKHLFSEGICYLRANQNRIPTLSSCSFTLISYMEGTGPEYSGQCPAFGSSGEKEKRKF